MSYALQASRLLLLVPLLSASSAHADIFTVGPDPSCTHETIATAILSAAGTAGPDEIRIATGTGNEEWPMWYDAQQLVIHNQDIELEGGYVLCYYAMPDSPQPHYDPALQPFLDGTGGNPAPVLRITGASNVTLRNLQLFRADNTSGKGGAISFDGRGSLTIENTWFGANRAAHGAGIYARGNGGVLNVTLGSKTQLIGNHATQDGGAIYLEGLATLDTTSSLGTVAFNSALRDGGGLYVRAPAAMHFAFAGDHGQAGLAQNSAARHGGGLFIAGLGQAKAQVTFKSLAGNPVTLHSNQAGQAGGAVYLSNSDDTNRTAVEFRNAYVEANKAASGSVVYQTHESSASHAGDLFFSRQGCTSGIDCNRVVGNVATSSAGGTFEFTGRVQQEIIHARISGNSGHHLMLGTNYTNSGPLSFTALDTNLIVDNTYSGSLFQTLGYSQTEVRSTTIANNQVGCGALFDVPDQTLLNRPLVRLHENVIDQPACDVIRLNAANVLQQETAYNIVHDRGIFLDADQSSAAAPAWFVDEAFGDYRLRPGAIAVNYAPYETGRDFHLNHRSLVDYRRNFAGPRDAGALEHIQNEEILSNGRFTGDQRAWRLTEQVGHLDPADADAGYGIPGEHSVRGFSTGTEDRIVVAQQCVPLPNSGYYTLSGVALARSSFSDPQAEDTPIVRYEVLRDTGSDCAGGVSRFGGTMTFAPADFWRQPASRPVILIGPEEWTDRTAMKITLEVIRAPGGNNTYALFDNLSLKFGWEAPVENGAIFKDSFEH
jgi:predicted outer membrane repeat protein